MKTKIAKISSLVFAPFFMPSYCIALVLFGSNELGGYIQNKTILVCFIFLFTAVLPISILFLLKRQKIISNLDVTDHKERLIPQIVTTIFYLGTSWQMLTKSSIPLVFTYELIGISIGLILITIISTFYKISAHASGIGGAWAFSLFMQYSGHHLELGTSILILGGLLTLWSRYHLKSHTLDQLASGLLLGIISGGTPLWMLYNGIVS